MSAAPADQPPQWRTNHYALIPQPGAPRVLLLACASGWSLPHVQLGQYTWLAEVGHLRPALLQLLGVDTTALRCAYAQFDHAARQIDLIYDMENHSLDWAPPDHARWVGSGELAELTLDLPEQRAVIANWLAELERGAIPESRPPWAQRGWLAAAMAWIQEHLARLGCSPLAPIEQVKSWGISCVLRARTSAGDAYFKAVPPLFAQEPAVTQALARLYPEQIPSPIMIDRERSWMLLWDFGKDLRTNPDIVAWEEALRLFSQLQRDSANRVDELLAAGCADRRLDVLAAQIDPLLDYAAGLGALDSAEIAQLRALAPRLKAMCAELASCGVPHALAHGDFHTGNIAFHAGEYIFFDWTDACIAHPFLDMATALNDIDMLAGVPDARRRLLDAYLSAWTAHAPAERLAAAFELGLTLGALHQAVSYRNIVAALEPASRQVFESDVPYWLRLVLSRATTTLLEV